MKGAMKGARVASALLLALGSLGSLLLAAVGIELAAILFAIGAFLVYFVWEVRERERGVIHLDLIFLAFFLAYAMCVPLYAQFETKDLSPVKVSEALIICLLCNIGYALGLLIAAPRSANDLPMEGARSGWKSPAPETVVKAGYIVFGMGLVISVLAVLMTVGFNAYLSAGYAGRALLKRENGPIEIGLYVCVSAIIAIYGGNILSRKTSLKSNLFVYACITFFVGYTAFLGIRRPMFLLIMGIFSCYSLIFRRPSLGRATAVLVPIMLLLVTFAQYRQIISTAGVSETVMFVRDNASSEWLDLSNNELGAPFRTLYDTISMDRLGEERLYGASYIITPLNMLPSQLGVKVESLSVQYTNRFFDQRFLDIGGNMGYFPATEAYVNFGYGGCVLIFALFALVLSRLNIYFHENHAGRAIMVAIFSVLVPWLAFFIRLDFASFMKGFFYSQIFSIFLIYLLANHFSAEFRRRQLES